MREICWLTGGLAQSEVKDPAVRELFEENWIGPYERLLPDWTWVAESEAQGAQRVQGYLTASPTTREFDRRRWWRAHLPLALRVAAGRYGRGAEQTKFLRRTFGLDPSPRKLFAPEMLARVLDEYPAHLHINVHPGAQRAGQGRGLMSGCLARLRAEGVRGLHLFCGPDPVAFYERQGLAVLDQKAMESGHRVHLMGISI